MKIVTDSGALFEGDCNFSIRSCDAECGRGEVRDDVEVDSDFRNVAENGVRKFYGDKHVLGGINDKPLIFAEGNAHCKPAR